MLHVSLKAVWLGVTKYFSKNLSTDIYGFDVHGGTF